MLEISENIESGKQARRWCFTINNPFEPKEEVNPETSDIPYKEDYYPKKVMLELEDSDCFVFKYVKVSIGADEFETEDFIVRKPFFKDLEHVSIYLEKLEHVKYFIYQLEKGENEQTEHVQGYISFNISKRFQTIKNALPFAHLEQARGTNAQCRDYCSKSETRVAGPFEYGQFAEERERTDIRDFMDLVKAGASKEDLSTLYPTLYLKYGQKIELIRSTKSEKYQTLCRDVKVTYIYGPSGVGKTSKVRRLLGFDDAFWVHSYDNSMFTNYNYQDVLIMDEFTGSMKYSTFNLMLDFKTLDLRGLGCAKPSCYHKVYIISNHTLKDIIKSMVGDDYKLQQTINRRIHRIIHFKSQDEMIIERDTEWEDCTNEVLKQRGIDRQVKSTWELDSYGNKVYTFNRYRR